MSLAERILERREAFRGGTLRLEVRTVELPDGSTAVREVVEHPDAVCAAVLTPDRRLVLVRQFRSAAGKVMLEVPAGKLLPGESPEEGLKRELLEEVGLVDGRPELLVRYHVAPGFCTEVMAVYLVRDAVLAQPCPEADEFLETVQVDLEEALAMAREGRLEDAKTLVAILAAEGRIRDGRGIVGPCGPQSRPGSRTEGGEAP